MDLPPAEKLEREDVAASLLVSGVDFGTCLVGNILERILEEYVGRPCG